MAGAQRPARRLVVPALQVRHHHLMEAHVAALAVQLEDLREVVEGRILDRDLVGNTTEERFVGDAEADKLLTREYRKTYVVPSEV